jgi:hypothetical protein
MLIWVSNAEHPTCAPQDACTTFVQAPQGLDTREDVLDQASGTTIHGYTWLGRVPFADAVEPA